MLKRVHAVIHYARIGKPPVQYRELVVEDDGKRVRTHNALPPGAFQPPWIEPEQRVRSVAKYLFYDQSFAIMELRDPAGRLLVYYCDVVTNLEKRGHEYFITDLFLDLVLKPDGSTKELDWDEFHEAVARGLLSSEQQLCATATLSRMKNEIASGRFPEAYIR